jgi:lipopolysaccharide transport system permease protein
MMQMEQKVPEICVRRRSLTPSDLAKILTETFHDVAGKPVATIYRYRIMLWAMILQGIRERISGSIFGFVFLIIYPLLFLGVYSVVFIAVLKVRVPEFSPETYSILIFCGLVPFLAFSEAFSIGTGSAVNNAGLIRNIIFPYELLPLKDVLTSYVSMVIGMALIFAAAVATSGFSPVQLLLPLLYFVQIIFTAGLVWITATLNVFFRDISKMMPIVLLLLMMLSPIGYTEAMVPPGLTRWLALNPLASFIFAYRKILVEHVIPYSSLLKLSALSVFLFWFGYFLMSRMRPLVSDYV